MKYDLLLSAWISWIMFAVLFVEYMRLPYGIFSKE